MKRGYFVGLFLISLFVSVQIVSAESATDSSSTKPLKREIQNKIKQERTEIKERVKQEKEEAREEIRKLKDQNKQKIVEKISANLAKINTRRTQHLKDVLAKLTEILEKVKSKAAEAQVAGKNTSSIDTLVVAAEQAIATAQDAVDAQAKKEYIIVITDETKVREAAKAAIESFHADMKQTQATVSAARKATHEAAKALRLIMGEGKKTGLITPTSGL